MAILSHLIQALFWFSGGNFMEHNETAGFKNKLSKRIINTPTSAARQTFFYMQETGCLKYEDAASAQRQNLDSFLIAAITSGEGELTSGSESFSVSEGECFFIDCNKPHCYKGSANNPWEILYIHFNGSTSAEYYDYFRSQSKPVFHPAAFDRVTTLINDIIRIHESCTPYAEIVTSDLILRLLTISLTSSSDRNGNDTVLIKKLAAVHSYIDNNFCDEISLEMLSSQFYISKFYLAREYKKIYGRTIFQHIITARINYGKQLLRFSDKSVEEISQLCGFNDRSYFARQFKKSENVTCFAYRKMWREQMNS
jgi:AraC-like DNA-binding protein